MKVGVYGGTFDPIHCAHLIIAECAYSQLELERFVFVPSYLSPHKMLNLISLSTHRLNMLKLAVAGNPNFQVSDFEIDKQGPSFTVDTLYYFREKYKLDRKELFLIIGADNFIDFSQWKDPETIRELAQIVVAGRPQHDIKNASKRDFIQLDSPLLDISASMIRKRVGARQSIRYFVPDRVIDYIGDNNLYI